jgi:hypothetical protein
MISLPMYPELEPPLVTHVAETLRDHVAERDPKPSRSEVG